MSVLEKIHFPVFGSYGVKKAGAVTIPGDILTLCGVTGRWRGNHFYHGTLWFTVRRASGKAFEINLGAKAVTARFAEGHYIGFAGVPLPNLEFICGNTANADFKEGENIFNCLTGRPGDTYRLTTAGRAGMVDPGNTYDLTAFYEIVKEDK